MWFILMAQVLAEGYGFGQYNAFAFLSLIQTIGVGMFCNSVIHDLSAKVFDTYSNHALDSKVTQLMLDELQHEDEVRHREVMQHLSARKPVCGGYDNLKLNVRFVMFQNSTSLSQALFFVWQIGTGACYFGKAESLSPARPPPPTLRLPQSTPAPSTTERGGAPSHAD